MFPSVPASGNGIKNLARSPIVHGFTYTAHQQRTSVGGANDGGPADTEPFLWSSRKKVHHIQQTSSTAAQWTEGSGGTPGVVLTTHTASRSQWTEYTTGTQTTEVRSYIISTFIFSSSVPSFSLVALIKSSDLPWIMYGFHSGDLRNQPKSVPVVHLACQLRHQPSTYSGTDG